MWFWPSWTAHAPACHIARHRSVAHRLVAHAFGFGGGPTAVAGTPGECENRDCACRADELPLVRFSVITPTEGYHSNVNFSTCIRTPATVGPNSVQFRPNFDSRVVVVYEVLLAGFGAVSRFESVPTWFSASRKPRQSGLGGLAVGLVCVAHSGACCGRAARRDC